MASEKVTVMILNVDLKCSCCYKKVKKLLCKFPQIRDQVFDEEKNKVKITVVCCNPEKLRDKLCCKGGKAIQSIEIIENKPKEPEKPKPIEKPKEPEKPKPVEKPKEPEKPKPKPAPVVVPVPTPAPAPVEKPKVDPPKQDPPKQDPPKKPDPTPAPMPPVVVPQPGIVMMPEPMHQGYPQPFCPPGYPGSTCCQECYEGRGGGPCHYGYGRPVPPPPGPCYDGYGYQYGGNRPLCVGRCDYFSEENPQGCSIM